MTDKKSDSLLIYAPVRLYQRDGEFLLEDQASNGLRLWADNFANVTVIMPLDPGTPPPNWIPLAQVGSALDRIEIVPLPVAYRPDVFFRHLKTSRKIIRECIDKADYLSFSIGGLFGDWGSVGCYEAHRKGRGYAVWTDRVESEVTRRTMHSGGWRKRLRARLTYRPMAWLEHALIRRAALGLFHGRETFDAYAPYCRTPEVVHDIHITKADHIPSDTLKSKLSTSGSGPLNIVYVGRADAMKGPQDWVSVLERVAKAGVDFRATWIGEGPELENMQQQIEAAGLADRVSLPGFARDRNEVLQSLRDAELFLFCHKTPESPRCLIEALISGTPIVGYDGAFARELTEQNGGGDLVSLDDVDALTAAVVRIGRDKTELKRLIERAARDGEPFDDESVFRHRCELIRKHL